MSAAGCVPYPPPLPRSVVASIADMRHRHLRHKAQLDTALVALNDIASMPDRPAKTLAQYAELVLEQIRRQT
jgi:hypothetical protein